MRGIAIGADIPLWALLVSLGVAHANAYRTLSPKEMFNLLKVTN